MRDLDVAIAAAERAADVIRRATSRDATFKSAVDPATETDRAAEEAILDVLTELRSRDGVLAEESGGHLDHDRLWVVDPLDGTVNFVHGIDHTAVSVALWVEGVPRVGVVVDVHRARTYTAVAGEGTRMGGELLRVTDRPIDEAVVASGYPYDRRERAAAYGDFTARLLGVCRGVRRFGAAALDLAWTAGGTVDGYIEPGLPHGVKPWDVAAGILLVREAGGEVVNGNGSPAGLEEDMFISGGPRTVAGLLAAMEGWELAAASS